MITRVAGIMFTVIILNKDLPMFKSVNLTLTTYLTHTTGNTQIGKRY